MRFPTPPLSLCVLKKKRGQAQTPAASSLQRPAAAAAAAATTSRVTGSSSGSNTLDRKKICRKKSSSLVHSFVSCYGTLPKSSSSEEEEGEEEGGRQQQGEDIATMWNCGDNHHTYLPLKDKEMYCSQEMDSLDVFVRNVGDIESMGRRYIKAAKGQTVVSPIVLFFVSLKPDKMRKYCSETTRAILWNHMFAACFVDPFLTGSPSERPEMAKACRTLLQKISRTIPPAQMSVRAQYTLDRPYQRGMYELVSEVSLWLNVPQKYVPRPTLNEIKKTGGTCLYLLLKITLRWMHRLERVLDSSTGSWYMHHKEPVYGIGYLPTGACVELPFTDTNFSMVLYRTNEDRIPALRISGLYSFLQRSRPVRCLLPDRFEMGSVGTEEWNLDSGSKWTAISFGSVFVSVPPPAVKCYETEEDDDDDDDGDHEEEEKEESNGSEPGDSTSGVGSSTRPAQPHAATAAPFTSSGDHYPSNTTMILDFRKKFYFQLVHKPSLIPIIMGTYSASS